MYNCKKGQTKSEDCYDMRLQANLPDERENLTCRHYITIQLTQLASFFIAGSMQRLLMSGPEKRKQGFPFMSLRALKSKHPTEVQGPIAEPSSHPPKQTERPTKLQGPI